MRVDLLTPTVTTSPGSTFELALEVFNTGEVIDGVRARPVGLDPSWVRSRPPQLALFPNSSGTIELEVRLPAEYPAGRIDLAVEVTSSVDPTDVEYVAFEVDVRPFTDITLQLEPERTSGIRSSRFRVITLNSGNTPVEIAFTAQDQERQLAFFFVPAVVGVAPGAAEVADVRIRTKRRWFGTPIDIPFDVGGHGRDIEVTTSGTFQQAPLIPRGAITAALLVGIVALWALIFLFVLSQVLGGDEPDKAAPPSFFATSAEALEAGAGAGAGGGAGGGGGGAGDQKVDLAVVGSAVTGTVTAESTGEGVGRITVEAVRVTRFGPELASSAATDDEGFYSLTGLVPGRYTLRFTSPGFTDVWYPAAANAGAADIVVLGPAEERSDLNAVITGQPGSVSGLVDTGVEGGPINALVILRPLVGGVPGQIVRSQPTSADGAFAISGLDTPASYEITATAPGYQPASVIAELGGGEQRLTATIRLSAGPGSIIGQVLGDGAPLGGVEITVIGGEVEAATATPTSGAVGRYALVDLPTPGTYLLTFSREGFGSETLAVDLGPGEQRTGLDVVLSRGTGSVAGTVSDTSGNLLGGVEVVVLGGGTQVTTSSLTTASSRGAWSVNGLTPGQYTATFRLQGYSEETISITLTSSGAVTNANARLAPQLAALRGKVFDSSNSNPDTNGVANATISVSDGSTVRETVSASSPAGTYAIVGLPPGAYSVTVTAEGFRPKTVLIELGAGASVVRDIGIDSGSASSSGLARRPVRS